MSKRLNDWYANADIIDKVYAFVIGPLCIAMVLSGVIDILFDIFD